MATSMVICWNSPVRHPLPTPAIICERPSRLLRTLANTVQGNGNTGQTTTATSYLFLATDEQTMDVTIETLDADGNTLFSKTVTDVPMRRNCLTAMTGAMYTNAGVSSGSFQINTEWLPGYYVPF